MINKIAKNGKRAYIPQEAYFFTRCHYARGDHSGQQTFSDHIGSTNDFGYAVTRTDALKVLQHFIQYILPNFGDHQDIMQTEEPFLYHSTLSLYINAGLLSPIEVCKHAENSFLQASVPINAAEGFIRQIIGWREYIRGVYWHFMPAYKNKIHFIPPKHCRAYWDAQTDMQCMHQSIQQTIIHGYAHHIQRLMVTGNFANLAGLSVQEVCDWYLAVYVDAFEWVELPNTLGMALHADQQLVGTKPYIASGAYINRMSNYCKTCRFDIKQKKGRRLPFQLLVLELPYQTQNILPKIPVWPWPIVI
ncbi:MAG: hypothetical protein R3A45_07320 [Bdellovibrionota bacterium]